MQWDAESGHQYHIEKMPGEADLAAFFHRLRPFILKSETTAFHRVRGILARRFKHPLVQAHLKQLTDVFSGRTFMGGTTISIDERVVNSETTLWTWLYGYEYHLDQDKRAVLEAIAPAMPLHTAEAIFTSMLLDKSKAVRELARLVKILMGRIPSPGGALSS